MAAALLTGTTVAAGSGRASRAGLFARAEEEPPDPVPPVDDAHRDQRDGGAREAVEPEVVAGGHDGEPDPGGPGDPEGLCPPVLRDARQDDSDDERIAR